MPLRKYDKADDGCCGRSLVRNYLLLFNGFFVLGVLVVLGVGIWSIVTEHSFISLLSDVSYPLTSYLLVGAGVIGLITALIGCCGIAKSDRCFLLVYIFLLLLVFLLEVMAGSLAFFYREEAFSDLQIRLNTTFMEKYGVDLDKTVAIDEMQQEFGCCGASGYGDWVSSRWMLEGHSGQSKVPDSCCKTVSFGCGLRDHPSNIYYSGCIHRLSDTVKNHLANLTIAGLGLCILQIIGVIFSTCLYVKLKNDDPTQL